MGFLPVALAHSSGVVLAFIASRACFFNIVRFIPPSFSWKS